MTKWGSFVLLVGLSLMVFTLECGFVDFVVVGEARFVVRCWVWIEERSLLPFLVVYVKWSGNC